MIADYLDRERVGHVLIAPADVVYSPRRSLQPDLFVTPLVNGRRPDKIGGDVRLLLVVEIISPSTAAIDRGRKRAAYREQGVDEYWVVDVDARTVERTSAADPSVVLVTDELVWHPSGAAESLTIDLRAYFSRILD